MNPPARLTAREGDEVLTVEQLEELHLFESMEKSPPMGDYPGYAILRRYSPDDDEPILWKDEPGWTAFYILTSEDLWELRTSQLRAALAAAPADGARVAHLRAQIAALTPRLSVFDLAARRADQLQHELSQPEGKRRPGRIRRLHHQIVDLAGLAPADADLRAAVASVGDGCAPDGGWAARVAEVCRARIVPRPAPAPEEGDEPSDDDPHAAVRVIFEEDPHGPANEGLWQRLRAWRRPARLTPPRESAVLTEGELFGEMSCRSRAPRSATVVALREIYVLEMLRNIYDLIAKDKKSRADLEQVYKSRMIDQHLRGHRLFRSFASPEPLTPLQKGLRDLSAEEYSALRAEILDEAELVTFGRGEIILDEFERADALYILCNGFVQVSRHQSCLLCADEVRDWTALCAALVSGEADGPAGPMKQAALKHFRGSPVWAALEQGARGEELAPALRSDVTHAVNQLISDAKFGGKAALVEASGQAADKPDQVAVVCDAKFRASLTKPQQDRYRNRLLLGVLYGPAFPPLMFRGVPHNVAYRGAGEFIGEVGLLSESRLRTSTCLAYDHPSGKTGDVELVRINAGVFEKLMRDSHFAEIVRGEVHLRARNAPDPGDAHDPVKALVNSERFEQLGLVQGQQLMLIDMDRCTRCDECIQACVQTHQAPRAGLSRLFLSGERIGRFLVPATCRQCTDPVCLIGCPVGAIHKGDLGQIVIESWCIGCTICSRSCSYDAIQMRPIGSVPRRHAGWRHALAPAGDDWTKREFDDGRWAAGQPPFHHDLAFRLSLGSALAASGAAPRIGFRYSHTFSEDEIESAARFLLQIESESDEIEAWVNGRPVSLESAGQGKTFGQKSVKIIWHRQALIEVERDPRRAFAAEGPPRIAAGRNVIAVCVSPADPARVLFDAGLFHHKTPEVPLIELGERAAEIDVIEELQMQQAVVCDLCASHPSQTPACVSACPHDAAWRGNPRAKDSPLRRISF